MDLESLSSELDPKDIEDKSSDKENDVDEFCRLAIRTSASHEEEQLLKKVVVASQQV